MRRRPAPSASKNYQHEDESGAALVEMAFVLPLLVLLIFGALEFGLMFKERLTISSAVSSAARTGATMGTREAADFRILEALEAGLYDQVDVGVLISVEIFNANPVDGSKIASDVNTYLFDPMLPCKWNPCPDPDNGSPPAYGGTWTPDVRDTELDPGGGGLDVLGIEVTYAHDAVTNLFSYLDRNFVERALVRLEPDVFGTGP